MKKLLWLDDKRDPFQGKWIEYYSPQFVGNEDNIIWVKNYQEFTDWITENGLPYKICFDHDLADEHYAPEEFWDDKYNDWAITQNFKEKTGYECAKWLIDYCIDNKLMPPLWVTHSANPVGAENINKILISFIQFIK